MASVQCSFWIPILPRSTKNLSCKEWCVALSEELVCNWWNGRQVYFINPNNKQQLDLKDTKERGFFNKMVHVFLVATIIIPIVALVIKGFSRAFSDYKVKTDAPSDGELKESGGEKPLAKGEEIDHKSRVERELGDYEDYAEFITKGDVDLAGQPIIHSFSGSKICIQCKHGARIGHLIRFLATEVEKYIPKLIYCGKTLADPEQQIDDLNLRLANDIYYVPPRD